MLIVDLEATCWEKTFRKHSEIIEIGACVTHPNYDIISEFQKFVQPVQNPILSDFCKNLTTILQSDVDTAEPFPKVLCKFIDWFDHYHVTEWGSWGQYDLHQILIDCNYHGLLFPLRSHVNIKKMVAEQMGEKPGGIQNTLKKLGLEFEGTQHRALEDVRNIVRILKKLEEM